MELPSSEFSTMLANLNPDNPAQNMTMTLEDKKKEEPPALPAEEETADNTEETTEELETPSDENLLDVEGPGEDISQDLTDEVADETSLNEEDLKPDDMMLSDEEMPENLEPDIPEETPEEIPEEEETPPESELPAEEEQPMDNDQTTAEIRPYVNQERNRLRTVAYVFRGLWYQRSFITGVKRGNYSPG
jgi:hypothetical protein